MACLKNSLCGINNMKFNCQYFNKFFRNLFSGMPEELSTRNDLIKQMRSRILSLPTIIFIAITSVLIVSVSIGLDLDWGQMFENISKMRPIDYVIGVCLYYTSFIVRGFRWKILAKNASKTIPSNQLKTNLPTTLEFAKFILIGWFINGIAWLRLGDAYRAWSFSRRFNSTFSWSLGTLLTERVLDMATILGILIVAILSITNIGDKASNYLIYAAAIMAGLLSIFLILMRLFGMKLAMLLPKPLFAIYGMFHKGTLDSLNIKQMPLLILLSSLGWLLEAGRLFFIIKALGLELSLPMILVVAVGHAILSTVPTPGGIGAVEAGVTGLLALSLPKNDAASVAILDRSVTFLSVIVFGGLVFFFFEILGIKISKKLKLPFNTK
ncbi:MAG: flippase-like domain-containing protein [SAR202 cluster bacterium]|nr:flippase-like domain-containing protein [SAR202 cluster bacterium]